MVISKNLTKYPIFSTNSNVLCTSKSLSLYGYFIEFNLYFIFIIMFYSCFIIYLVLKLYALCTSLKFPLDIIFRNLDIPFPFKIFILLTLCYNFTLNTIKDTIKHNTY